MYQIAVIGPNRSACTPELYVLAERLGAALATRSVAVVSGGMGGVMEAVFKGVQTHRGRRFVPTIGILSATDASSANAYCDVVLPTGLGVARNALVVQAGDSTISLGGGAGTLSELALAWQYGKTVLCYTGAGGWSERLAGVDLDQRRSGLLIPVASLSELLQHLDHARRDMDAASGFTPRST